MSYVNLTPAYYQTGVPDTPLEHGAPGWETAWVPGWGENPAQAWAPNQGVHGDDPEVEKEISITDLTVPVIFGAAVGATGAYFLFRKKKA